MDAFRLRFRGKLDYVPFKLLKNRMTVLCSDRHKEERIGRKYRLVGEKAIGKASAF
jgi:hypothetical protein